MYGRVHCKDVCNVKRCSMYGCVQCKDVFKVWMCLIRKYRLNVLR